MKTTATSSEYAVIPLSYQTFSSDNWSFTYPNFSIADSRNTANHGISYVNAYGSTYEYFLFAGTKYEMQISLGLGGVSNRRALLLFHLIKNTSNPLAGNTPNGPDETVISMPILQTGNGGHFSTDWRTIYINDPFKFGVNIGTPYKIVVSVLDISGGGIAFGGEIRFKRIY